MAIASETRMAAIARAQGFCEYCRVALAYSPDPLVLDHIRPVSQGGGDDLENLAVACWGCNGHKAAGTRAFDPIEARLVPLFNPRTQAWREHFRWSEDGVHLIGLTAVGRATTAKLNLNRPGLLNLRAVLRLAGKLPKL